MVLLLFETLYAFSQDQKTIPNEPPPGQQIQQQQQGLKRAYEFGLSFSGLNSFGINFKTGNQKTMYRVTLLLLNINSNQTADNLLDSSTNKITTIGAGVRFGLEKRIFLAKNFNLHLGSDAAFSYTYYKNSNGNSGVTKWVINPAIHLVLGLAYEAWEHFLITAEFSPSFEHDFGRIKTTQPAPNYDIAFHHFDFGLSTRSVSLTIAYRILKTILFKW